MSHKFYFGKKSCIESQHIKFLFPPADFTFSPRRLLCPTCKIVVYLSWRRGGTTPIVWVLERGLTTGERDELLCAVTPPLLYARTHPLKCMKAPLVSVKTSSKFFRSALVLGTKKVRLFLPFVIGRVAKAPLPPPIPPCFHWIPADPRWLYCQVLPLLKQMSVW